MTTIYIVNIAALIQEAKEIKCHLNWVVQIDWFVYAHVLALMFYNVC
jgi:hypothetical protein